MKGGCIMYKVYYIIIVYLCAIWYVILQCFQNQLKPSKLKRNNDLVALITGGARGIGLETSFQLLKQGATVVIAGIYEDQKEGLLALKEIANDEKVKFIPCNLSSLESVKKLADDFLSLNIPLHLLINNAGIMFSPFVKTNDGIESHWSVNFLGHFLLTHLLLPKLAESSVSSNPSRVVNLSSCLHYPGTINFDDINGENCYSAEAAYCQSKLAMLLFAISLNKKLKSDGLPVIINAVHPAVAFSNLYTHIWWSTWIPTFAKFVLNTPLDGSYTVVHAALSSEVKEGGKYFENCHSVLPSKEARSDLVQGRLWDISCKQLGIKEFGKP